MLIKRQIVLATVGWILAFWVAGGLLSAHGQTSPSAAPKLLIKIRDIDRLIQNMESLMPADAASAPASQAAMIKGLLQGTDWIDSARPIVAGLYYDGQASSWLVFLPFTTPNEAFRGAYGAIAGQDYYLMRFPPAPDLPLPDAQRDDLIAASRRDAAADLVVELAAREAVRQSESQIEAALQNLAAGTVGSSRQMPLTPEETQQLVRNLIDTVKQMETVRIGLNFDPDALQLLMDVVAVPDSYLAGLLTDHKADVRLPGYRPEFPMQFRSRAYNVAGVMQMLGAAFGPFYQKMGFDFDTLTEIAKALTGEMAGGMALDQGQMQFEMIYALHDTVDGDDYLTRVYLPWFEKYNRQMAAFMEEQTGQPVTPLYERMPETTVAGRKVIGVRTRFPAMTPAGSQISASPVLQDYQTRMAAVDDLVLMASSDAAIAKMMARVADLKKAPAQGPLAEFTMDLGAYLRGVQSLVPAANQTVTIPADLGHMTMQAEMQAGRLTTRTQVNVQDLQQTISLFAALSEGMAQVSTGTVAGASDPQNPVQTIAAVPSSAESQKTPAYWMDRGGLFSAYGAYQAAVRCYQKALALAPDLAEAHFQLGVAYGELGRYEAAVQAISRAIDRMPTQGEYFYGRGRVYLLAGEEELAMKDFMEAGFLGNADARAYLQSKGVDWN
jgi:hypothetical protein